MIMLLVYGLWLMLSWHSVEFFRSLLQPGT